MSRRLTGGRGYSTVSGLRVIQSRANTSNGWQIKVVNNNTDFLFLEGSVYAECLSGTRAVAVGPFLSTGVDIAPGKFGCDDAHCPNTDRDVLAGVGFVSSSAFELANFAPAADTRFFHICGRNTNPSQAIHLQAFGTCLNGVTGGLRAQATATVAVPPSTRATTRIDSAACPNGTQLSFGSISFGDSGLITLASQRSSNFWRAEVFNTNSFRTTASLNTYCLDLFQ